jgi:hypothetical protein
LQTTGHYPGIAFAQINLDALGALRLGKDIAAVRREGIESDTGRPAAFRRPEMYKEIVEPCDNAACWPESFWMNNKRLSNEITAPYGDTTITSGENCGPAIK